MPGRACLCIPLNKLKVFTRRRIRRESLEKEKALAARRRQFIFYFGNVRQRSSLEGRERIVLEQRAPLLFAKPVDNHVVGRLQTKRRLSRVVRAAATKWMRPSPIHRSASCWGPAPKPPVNAPPVT